MQQDYELRIGNLVKNEDGTICPVTQLLINDFGLNVSARCNPVSKRTGGMIDKYYPIELTREILEAIGFVRSNSEAFPNQITYTKAGITLNGIFQLCTYDGGMAISRKRIEFIHQLQNLYLLLIGQELEINKDTTLVSRKTK